MYWRKLAEFVTKESVSITTLYDSGNESGRQNYYKLIKNLHNNKVPTTFVYQLIDIFSKVKEDAHFKTHTIKTEMDQMEKRKQHILEVQLPAAKAIKAASFPLASTSDHTPATTAARVFL